MLPMMLSRRSILLEKTPSLQLLNFSLQEEYLFWIIILHLLISTFDSDIQSKSLMMLSSFIHNYGHIFLSSTDLIVFTIIFHDLNIVINHLLI